MSKTDKKSKRFEIERNPEISTWFMTALKRVVREYQGQETLIEIHRSYLYVIKLNQQYGALSLMGSK